MTEAQCPAIDMPQKEAMGFDPTTDGGVPTKPSRSRQFGGNFASEGGTSVGVRARAAKNNWVRAAPGHEHSPSAGTFWSGDRGGRPRALWARGVAVVSAQRMQL